MSPSQGPVTLDPSVKLEMGAVVLFLEPLISTKSCLTNASPNREDAHAQAMKAPDSRIEITINIEVDHHHDPGVPSERE